MPIQTKRFDYTRITSGLKHFCKRYLIWIISIIFIGFVVWPKNTPPTPDYANTFQAAIASAEKVIPRSQTAKINPQPLTQQEENDFSQPTPKPIPQATPEVEERFSVPELPLPASGASHVYVDKEPIAPFQILPSFGTNYFVKLVDQYSKQTIMCIFVQGGIEVNVDVPLGTYEVLCASGDKWYGVPNYFGPATIYCKAEEPFTFRDDGNSVAGYTLTLRKVIDGNLHMPTISKDEFDRPRK